MMPIWPSQRRRRERSPCPAPHSALQSPYRQSIGSSSHHAVFLDSKGPGQTSDKSLMCLQRIMHIMSIQGMKAQGAHAFASALQEAAAVTRSQAARHHVQGHTVSVSLLSDSEDEHRPEEVASSPSVHVNLRVQHHEQPASEHQLANQLLEQQQLCEALQSRSVG